MVMSIYRLLNNYLMIIFYFFLLLELTNAQKKIPLKNRPTTKPAVKCAENEFACKNKVQCVDFVKTCDGQEYDCSDNSDEGDQCYYSQNKGCTLPAQTEDKSYAINCHEGVSKYKPSMVENKVNYFTTLTFTCHPGYTREKGNNIFNSYCLNGTWTPKIRDCKKICRRLFPSDLNLECYRNDIKVNCHGPMLTGTKVRATCKPQYKLRSEVNYEEITCNENGQWNNPLPDCVLECGKLEGNDTAQLLGHSNNYNQFPWHVAIYDIRKSPILICSGTIISPVLVLSAATCLYDKITKTKLNVHDFELVVSKVTPNYYIQDNEFQTHYRVQEVYTEKHSLAIFELSKKIVFGHGVVPACVGLQFHEDLEGRVASWGLTNDKDIDENSYRIDEYLTKSYEECTTEEDKFCGQQKYGAGSNMSDTGAGFIHKHDDNLYYVIGVMNIKYRFKSSFTIICTNLETYYNKWLFPLMQKMNEERLIDVVFKTRPECEFETSFNAKQQKASICSKRQKLYSAIPPCKRICSKLQPKNVNLTCTYNNQSTDCASELVEGTKVAISCLRGYKPKYAKAYQYIECQDDGEWSNELYECIPDDTRSCILPAQTKDKYYTVDCNSRGIVQPDEYVEELTMLAFQCKPGYYYREIAPTPAGFLCKPDQYYHEKVNNFQVICINGSWSPEISSCTKLCKALPSMNLKPECFFNGEKIDCNRPLVAGTSMHPLCEKHYRKKYVTDFEELVCDENGDWDNVPIECVPACGRNVISEYTNDYEEIPFHISIIDKKLSSPVCAGTLISPYLVLTTAKCFYNSKTRSLGNANNYEIIAGKKIKLLSSSLNKNVLKFTNFRKSYQVKNIYFTNKGKNKVIANYSEDLAILETVSKVELNVNTIPACVNWHQSTEYDLKPYFSYISEDGSAQSGKLAKWDTDFLEADGTYIGSQISLSTYLHYSYDVCKGFLQDKNQDKTDLFCLWSTPGTKLLNDSDLGAGYIQVRGDWDLYHVQGVYSAKTSNDSYLLMINVNYHANWLKRISDYVEKQRSLEEMRKNFHTDIFDNPDNTACDNVLSNLSFGTQTKLSISCKDNIIDRHFANGCHLPTKQDYNIEYREHTCPPNIYKEYCLGVKENGSVPELTKLDYRCKEGYAVENGVDSNHMVSFCNGKWEPAILQCKKHCKKLKPVNVNLTCLYNGAKVNCDGNLVRNTIVTPKCLPEYEPEYTPSYQEITCLEDGDWSDTLYHCKPRCGRSAVKKITTLIRGGHDAVFGEFPWHVAIFNKALNKSLICGGTIISPYVVLSAAHCFYDQFNKKVKPAQDYEIAVGKISRDYTQKDSEITVFYEVENIVIENFLGIKLRYQYDIAILLIKNKIEFNPQVLPVCIPHTPLIIPSGELLNVCGWGVDDTDTFSTKLRVAELPYLSISECVKNAPEHIVEYISVDKFCVANVNGSIVERGDSGGGLTRIDKTTKLHYLVGIVSFKAVDLPTVAIITDTNQILYLNWISVHMNEMHRIKQYEI